MGIIANTKAFIARKTKDAAKKTSDFIATSATLSPIQLTEIENKKADYFEKLSNMNSEQTIEYIERNLGSIAVEVHQAYLNALKEIYRPVDCTLDKFDELNRIKYFDITKWVTDSEEKNLDKLVNVYQVINEEYCNIALIYNRKKDTCKVTIAVANMNEDQGDPAIVNSYINRFSGALKGNFPGVKTQEIHEGIPETLKGLGYDYEDGSHSVAIVSNLASEKSKDFISQSMEKLLDGIVPQNDDEEYTVVLIATPVIDRAEKKNRLYETYSSLIPYASWQTSYTCTETESIGSNATLGANAGFSFGSNRGTAISASADGVGVSQNHGTHKGFNFGAQFARMSNVSVQIGKNEGLTQTYGNYGVQHTLKLIEKQLERIEESSALGMWEFAAYVTSKSPVIANNVASMYLSLTQGDESYISNACVKLWDGEKEEETITLLKSIQKLQHPVFGLKESYGEDWLQYPTLVTPATFLTGKELAKALNFPRKSISGLPVIECAEFGRDVMSIDDKFTPDLDIGKVYHMHNDEKSKVFLSSKDMTAHTFITGSTGSGKSNVIYQLLSKAVKEKNIKFMVVEPAKGEYKDVFGLDEELNVSVYGTNPKVAPLLRINPFKFPETTHIYEHMDKLVEIFNVCWPMYAAMPAVLKAALEKAYISAGWDLMSSQNKTGVNIYPTFASGAREVKKYIDKSEYSEENKGNYKGSLLTRLESLTNGINGMIFTADDLKDEELFDENVIVDLSRVGSTETKALIMGILVMKLQEYRSACKKKNSELKHITVLEEAHNLLKRTSTEQSMEGSNLIGKSVEMLANSIAEMRTYGEGFIIADQAPGLLDMSVIRNTNTKIILRLPDYSDRELVGKSANLNDSQIDELAKLKTGVAAVYQNGWVAPVLCQFDRYEVTDENAYFEMADTKNFEDEAVVDVLNLIMKSDIRNAFDDADADELKSHIITSNLPDWLKVDILECFVAKNDVDRGKKIAQIAYEFFKAEQTLEQVSNANDILEWQKRLKDTLIPSIKDFAEYEIEHLLALLVHEHYLTHSAYEPIYLSYMEYLGNKYNY